MKKTEVLETIRSIVRDDLNRRDPVDFSTDLIADLQLDSVDLLAFVVELENRLEVCLDIEAGIETARVEDVIALAIRGSGTPGADPS